MYLHPTQVRPHCDMQKTCKASVPVACLRHAKGIMAQSSVHLMFVVEMRAAETSYVDLLHNTSTDQLLGGQLPYMIWDRSIGEGVGLKNLALTCYDEQFFW